MMQTKQVAETFLCHSRYRFQLKANPTMRRSCDRRRLGIYNEDQLYEWIQRKASQNGFEAEVDALVVGGPQNVVFVRNGKRGKHVAVDFQGILCVKERETFKDAFEKGIGSAKSFGFGLLMLQPMS
jgi:CRISPR system Cascade subunit CasE